MEAAACVGGQKKEWMGCFLNDHRVSHVAEHAMASSIYTNNPFRWLKLANARVITRWNTQGTLAMLKGRTLNTYFPFEVTNAVL